MRQMNIITYPDGTHYTAKFEPVGDGQYRLVFNAPHIKINMLASAQEVERMFLYAVAAFNNGELQEYTAEEVNR
jgi:hypothetical protein